jgi:L-iditol 2-dehydrogenase
VVLAEMLAVRKMAVDVPVLSLERVPVPEPRPGQARIRVTGAGICGTDQHILDGDYASRPPVTLGHEVAGFVDAVGAEVDPAWIGALVAPETAFSTCGACPWCRNGKPMLCRERVSIGSGTDGGFAAAMVVPARLLHRLPDGLDPHAAALLEPLACVCNSVLDPNRIEPGDTVIVSGAGPVGLLAAQVARAAGGDITVTGTDVDAERLAIARDLGFATRNVADGDDRAALDELGRSRAVDVVLECAGAAAAVAAALRWIRPGGRLVQIGLIAGDVAVPFGEIVTRELAVSAGFGSSPRSWRRAVRLVEQGAIELLPLVSHVHALRDHEAAFARFAARDGLKTIFDPRLDAATEG